MLTLNDFSHLRSYFVYELGTSKSRKHQPQTAPTTGGLPCA